MKILNHGDQNLLLQILLTLEKGLDHYVTYKDIKIEGYDELQIRNHIAYLDEAGLIQGQHIPEGVVTDYIVGDINIYGRMVLRRLREENLI